MWKQHDLFRTLLHRLLLVAFVGGMLPTSTAMANQVDEKIPPVVQQAINIQPVLQQLAIEEPELLVDLIVQQNAGASVAEGDHVVETVSELGGTVTRDLSMIQALAVTMQAAKVSALAQLPAVRWISLDGQLDQSNTLSAEDAIVLREEFDGDPAATLATQQQWTGLGTWSGQPWQEVGEQDGPQGGDVALARFYGGAYTGLRLQGAGKGLIGAVNLTDAEEATLRYSYRRKDFAASSHAITVDVSIDGGNSWATVAALSGPATDATLQFAEHDLSAYGGHEVAIRFLTSETLTEANKFYVDFVEIEFVPKHEAEPANVTLPAQMSEQLFLPLIMDGTEERPAIDEFSSISAAEATAIRNVSDIFHENSFDSDNGWETWGGPWIEVEPYGGGVGSSSGQVQVTGNALQLKNSPNQGGYPSAARRVNLGGGVASARLEFGFFTSNNVDTNDAVVVEVSKDGGNSYTILETITGIAGHVYQHRTYNVSNFVSPNFMVRFRVAANYGVSDESFSVDWIRVFYDRINMNADWVSLVPAYSYGWKYLDNGSNQGTAWRQPGYNDNNWPVGQTELGYGDWDEGTTVSYGSNANNKRITTYFRRTFHVPDADEVYSLELRLLRDDGAIVYLNGTEIVRSNMPSGSINYKTLAWGAGDRDDETTFHVYQIDPTLLVNGKNVIAVEVHQASVTSSDLSFNLELGGWNTCVDCINISGVTGTHARSVRATELWNGSKRIQGQGIAVAVVDSGIAPHQDNTSALVTNRVLTHVDFTNSGSTSIDDANGHGSHVAGIIAGNGSKSRGAYLGIAPNANLVDVKVTDDKGRGSTSNVVAGLQWIYENKDLYNIRVVNLSLNTTLAESYHNSPLNAALEILWFNGVVVVVSAGNNGTTNGGVIYPPANDPFVLTVGAVDDRGTTTIADDTIPSFSAYGTTIDGFAKPDIVAPGRNIISLLSSDDSNLAVAHPIHKVLGQYSNEYFRMSGTSMASAVVAGAAALLLQDEPTLTPDQVKYRLMATSKKNWSGYTAAKAGAGYLDIYAAVNGTTTAKSNTNIAASQLLWSGSEPVLWGSVSWNSVSWNSVSWNSVSWNSVSWNSVSWNSVTWDDE